MSAGPKQPEMYSYEEIVGFVEQGSETEVVLFTGCSERGSTAIQQTSTAGGKPMDEDCGAPSEEQSVKQARGNHGYDDQVDLVGIIEYSANQTKAMGFARMAGVLIAVQIRAKYLNKGSVAESGFVCFKSAPIKFLGAHVIPPSQRVVLKNKQGGYINAD